MRLKLIFGNRIYNLPRSPSSWQLHRDCTAYCTRCESTVMADDFDNPERFHCWCGNARAELIGTIQPNFEFVEN